MEFSPGSKDVAGWLERRRDINDSDVTLRQIASSMGRSSLERDQSTDVDVERLLRVIQVHEDCSIDMLA
jgi:hypothetical protein